MQGFPIDPERQAGLSREGGSRGGEVNTGRLAAWARLLATTSVVAVILAISGGFGTDVLTAAPRAAYWFGLCTLGAVIGNLVAHAFPQAWFLKRPIISWSGVAILIASAMAPVVALTNAAIRHRPLSLNIVADILPGVVVTSAGLTALAALVRRRDPLEAHAAGPGAVAAPRFLERLSPKLRGGDLWAVEAQDHYLRLHTSKGRDLLLMRLSDAISELEGLEGARTHRSWWVARAAVVGVERTNGRAILTLIDGTEAPVSRGFAKILREAGWFEH